MPMMSMSAFRDKADIPSPLSLLMTHTGHPDRPDYVSVGRNRAHKKLRGPSENNRRSPTISPAAIAEYRTVAMPGTMLTKKFTPRILLSIIASSC
jgi:hypothetical protein